MFIDVLYEDDDVIVVDKPAGIVCERGPGSTDRALPDHLRDYLKRRNQRGMILPLHRLDRETSGVMVYAKSRIGGLLEESFKAHKNIRVYLALVAGRVEAPSGRLTSYLEKGDFGGGKKMRVGKPNTGDKAVTDYKVVERYGRATLLELRPQTGRTHQLRVQLADLGHSMLGDAVYGIGRLDGNFMALHASELHFTHPSTGRLIRCKAPLPRRFAELVNKLREGR